MVRSLPPARIAFRGALVHSQKRRNWEDASDSRQLRIQYDKKKWGEAYHIAHTLSLPARERRERILQDSAVGP